MVWDINAPYKAESKKIVWDVAPYLRGRGVDIGAGDFKVLPHVISVDNMHHAQFGFNVRPDVMVKSADKLLDVFAWESMDFVYSSHLLEHMEDPEKALKEWWGLVKQGGCMILYLPHEDLYPKVGEEGANPDHKRVGAGVSASVCLDREHDRAGGSEHGHNGADGSQGGSKGNPGLAEVHGD